MKARPSPQFNSKPEEAAFVLLRNSMAYSDQIAGAVAILVSVSRAKGSASGMAEGELCRAGF